ncbi:MAG: tRNA (adenosine(37)-N6)-dimethylallyltransferase MiaA [Proteobacteria bacterium]|nr:tRNA (adenosine(37)-N6)-dimethylallyltransferase MiaA [Pseudomonadota bacterium]
MGATASGKTAMALELVRRHNFQIISVDSVQVYRGMDIGTGKPDAATLEIAPHRLIDIRDPSEVYSASEFRADALTQIAEVLAAGDTPLLVGGTMLYYKVLRDGLADLPRADAEVRTDIEALAEAEGWGAVHRQLAKVDPESAARIHPNDPQRLQRALEVFLVSGKSMTQLHAEDKAGVAGSAHSLSFNLHFFAIQAQDRAVLHHQIERRFLQMLHDGLVAEVEVLYQCQALNSLLPSIKSVGYRQVWQYLAGDLNYDAMVEKGIIATRQLAKRQLTWLRSWENLQSLDVASAKSFASSIASVLNYVHSISI